MQYEFELWPLLNISLIFPFNSRLPNRDPFDPVRRIDREVGERARRLFIGISLQPDLNSIIGALTVIEGKGKYLRVVGSTTCKHQLDAHTKEALRQFLELPDPSLLDWRAIQQDIAVVFSHVAEELKSQAGKYLDRLMVIATHDPGKWTRDSAGELRYAPLCDPNLLADTTGITAVDSFVVRDLATGGCGAGLFSLPAWLLFADRTKPIANHNRLFINSGVDSEAYYLPASDGLDVEIPDIKYAHISGKQILRQHFNLNDHNFESELQHLNIQGQCRPNLIADIRRSLQNAAENGTADAADTVESQADFARSFIVACVDELMHRIQSQTDAQAIEEVIVDGSELLLGSWVNQFQRSCPGANVRASTTCFDQANVSSAILTSLLGAMNVDQLPGNIPWVTGASSQRILGRITSGSPSNWRLLLREMADFQPPAMRLRDAI